MIYQKNTNSPCYFPPMVGNGDLAFSVDMEGVTDYEEKDFPEIKCYGGYIFRMGRRLANLPNYLDSAALFGFGKLKFCEGTKIVDWTQELCQKSGLVKSRCTYEDGVNIETESFLLRDLGVYIIRKNASGLSENKSFSFTYQFKTHSDATEAAIMSYNTSPHAFGGKVDFKIYGHQVFSGEARLISFNSAVTAVSEREVTITVAARENEPITVALLLEDSIDGDDFKERLDKTERYIKEQGYDALRKAHVEDWDNYFKEGYVKTENQYLNEAYNTALYHLRSYATKWSIPVGIYPEGWNGKFFAFDEYYSMLALLEANRSPLAKRVPEFRLRVCLPEALRRSSNFRKPDTAHFYWQTSELGKNIGTPGFWDEHISQMALVALGAYEYYEYTQDKDFLLECYPMIRACACFYTRNSIYRDGERYYVGKCTDLERMGPYVENSFMSTCSVIRALECFVSTVDELLIEDNEYRDKCDFLAKKLRESLPQNETMYIPHPKCEQKSIAMFACKYPFNVLPSNDGKMLAAWHDYLLNEKEYGNNYKVGSGGVSSWYAAWKANAFARIHEGKDAYSSLMQSLYSAGTFAEMFEINDNFGTRWRPWFSTASGVLMSAIHAMLVQSDGEKIEILPAYPINDEDVSFRLSVKGGAIIDVEIKKGELVRSSITMRHGVNPKKFKILYKGKEI